MINVINSLPPDPGDVAPPLDSTVATTIATATEFIYTDSNPIQTGIAPRTIEPHRVGVLTAGCSTGVENYSGSRSRFSTVANMVKP